MSTYRQLILLGGFGSNTFNFHSYYLFHFYLANNTKDNLTCYRLKYNIIYKIIDLYSLMNK